MHLDRKTSFTAALVTAVLGASPAYAHTFGATDAGFGDGKQVNPDGQSRRVGRLIGGQTGFQRGVARVIGSLKGRPGEERRTGVIENKMDSKASWQRPQLSDSAAENG